MAPMFSLGGDDDESGEHYSEQKPVDHALRDVQGELRRVQGELRGVLSELKAITLFITGGPDPEKGMILQMDRLKQQAEARKAWSFVFGSAAAAALVGTVWQFITSHKGS